MISNLFLRQTSAVRHLLRLPSTLREGALGGSYDGWILSAAAVGVAVRLLHVIHADFPLNDGGLFYMMIEAIRASDYRLPESIPWAQFELPFAYPPLGFYVAAAIADATGLSTIELLRILPFVGSATVVIAFAGLARSVVPDRIAAVSAVFIFSLDPGGYAWSVSGGGLTRTLGQTFCLLALHQLLQQFRRPDWRRLSAVCACTALTVLSHPESATVLAGSAALLTLSYGRTISGLRTVITVTVATLGITSFWWVVALDRYGLETYSAAGGNSNGLQIGVALLASSAHDVLAGALFGLLCMLALITAWLAYRQLFVAAWLLAVLLLSRNGAVYTAPAAALLTGIGLARLLTFVRSRGFSPARLSSTLSQRGTALRVSIIAALAVCGVALYSLVISLQAPMPTLPKEERDAMAWISENTHGAASFLVMSPRLEGTSVDPTGDWFAALTGRVGLSPPQGTEWLGAYEEVERAYAELLKCRSRDTTCLEAWASRQSLNFDYVYVPVSTQLTIEAIDGRPQSCCEAVMASLLNDTNYRLVYGGSGASVFERIE